MSSVPVTEPVEPPGKVENVRLARGVLSNLDIAPPRWRTSHPP